VGWGEGKFLVDTASGCFSPIVRTVDLRHSGVLELAIPEFLGEILISVRTSPMLLPRQPIV
jgi:hypothetical protein